MAFYAPKSGELGVGVCAIFAIDSILRGELLNESNRIGHIFQPHRIRVR